MTVQGNLKVVGRVTTLNLLLIQARDFDLAFNVFLRFGCPSSLLEYDRINLNIKELLYYNEVSVLIE
ncbi:MAG: hypothetical protein H3Z52_12955 [archaeon]|nr:hypothetical protein [archaeon]MCP8321824.1 hypothetical protein [archaeon]